MSYAIERQLIETAYQAGMPANDPIQFSNVTFKAPSGGYTRLKVLSGGGSRLKAFVGTTQRRYAGAIDVAIFVPTKMGTAGLRAKADEVETALAHKTLTSGAVQVRTFGADFVEIGEQGDWYQGNITIRFERDTN
jgi:hypothetical protein